MKGDSGDRVDESDVPGDHAVDPDPDEELDASMRARGKEVSPIIPSRVVTAASDASATWGKKDTASQTSPEVFSSTLCFFWGVF